MAKGTDFIEGDFGVPLRARIIKEDSTETISDGTSFFIDIERPDGTKVTRTAALDTSTNKHITYTVVADDTAQVGVHRGHGVFKKSTAEEQRGEQFFFHVLVKFEGKGDPGASNSLVI